MEKIERPALGALKLGDPVIVLEHSGYQEPRRELPATVVKVARVWVTVKIDGDAGWGSERRFRLDTQSDGSQYTYGYRFITPEQRAYDERMASARAVLSDAGVRLDFSSPFQRDDAATLALAERVAQIVASCVARESTDA